MALIQQKQYSPAQYNLLSIINPGAGGLNLQDLDYLLPVHQSPRMTNMMYKNGVFGKRYGQTVKFDFEEDVHKLWVYKDKLLAQTDTGIYEYDGTQKSAVYTGDLSKGGFFFTFNRKAYFMSTDVYLEYEGTGQFTNVVPYIPTIMITRKPDGSSSQTTDYNYNSIGAGFTVGFNGDGSSTAYHLPTQEDENGNKLPLDATLVTAIVGTSEWTEGDGHFTVDRANSIINFATAPATGTDNVMITAYVTNHQYSDAIRSCKYACAYGGNNNSHLFLAGNGKSTFYYSDVFDASYFPEMNYVVVGSAEDDITGFGLQYNVLIVFKPSEIFSVNYTIGLDSNGKQTFLLTSMPVNNEVGCDMPYTIQYIDNRLTWGNTDYGICTLCSTVIQDERNVRVISRNINGGEREQGLLQEDNLSDAIALDHDGKYIVFVNRHAYMWDYTNAPFSETLRQSIDQSAKATSWYFWDDIGYPSNDPVGVQAVAELGTTAMFITNSKLITFDYTLNDFDEAIYACYQTPMFDFQAFESLKTIKSAFFEVRGDTPSITKITYITDEDPMGERDPEDIEIPAVLWEDFRWSTFGWEIMQYARTFARKCSIKKVMLFGILLENDQPNRDMTVSGIKMKYTVVKEVK